MTRRKATFGRRCVRCWVRHNGRIIRMLHVNDYRACEHGGDPRLLIKLLDHRRYAPGVRLVDPTDWWGTQVLPHLVRGQWVEVDIL